MSVFVFQLQFRSSSSLRQWAWLSCRDFASAISQLVLLLRAASLRKASHATESTTLLQIQKTLL